MARLTFPLCLFLLTSLSGCGNEAQKSPSEANVRRPIPIRDVESVLPGPRPSSIDGARFLKGSEFFALDLEDYLPKGIMTHERPWFVVEGIVERFSTRKGDRIFLKCDNCPRVINCDLRSYGHKVEPGQNLVIKGQLYEWDYLGYAEIVTQAQIDEAIRKEQGEEQPTNTD